MPPLTVIALIRAKPGKERELRAALLKLIEPTRQEKACINYDLHFSEDEPGLFVFYENWESEAELEAHLRTPHLEEFFSQSYTLLAEPVEIKKLRQISSRP